MVVLNTIFFEEKILKQLRHQIVSTIQWARVKFNLPLLILHVEYTFSKRNSISWVKGSFLEFDVFFSLEDILSQAMNEKLSLFCENESRIPDFVGDWKECLQSLVYHEMSHIFDFTAFLETTIHTCYSKYYPIEKKIHKNRKIHGQRWAAIYSDLKKDNPPYSDSKIICIPQNKKFDIYFSNT